MNYQATGTGACAAGTCMLAATGSEGTTFWVVLTIALVAVGAVMIVSSKVRQRRERIAADAVDS